MAVHSFKQTQRIPINVSKAWDFFSRPANLPSITPPDMKFRIISKYHGEKMYAGQLIEYRVRVAPFLPSLYWMTEITQVHEGIYFIDEQRFGPYRFWHHQHHFRAISIPKEGHSETVDAAGIGTDIAGTEGVEMTDIVHYEVPFAAIGYLADKLFVARRLRNIFDYRLKRIETLFGTFPQPANPS
ncbi:MAG: SRPBCC family protein [Puia sp.]|nr:SRPBCC family protein [Puia sp.]